MDEKGVAVIHRTNFQPFKRGERTYFAFYIGVNDLHRLDEWTTTKKET